MILELRQINKDLYAARFVLFGNNCEVGSVSVNGKFGKREAAITGKLYDTVFELNYGKNNYAVSKPFRPYKIKVGGTETGIVYQTEEKTGMFKSRTFHQMVRNGRIFECYAVALAGESTKYPMYCGSEQIALAEADRTVYNDLFHFRIYAADDDNSLTALLFCLYMYINACYKPGEKVTQSVSTSSFVTTDPFLLDKYNPQFKSMIEE